LMYTCVEQETQTQSKSPIPESFTSCQDDGTKDCAAFLPQAPTLPSPASGREKN
jgi:hypothetical protein